MFTFVWDPMNEPTWHPDVTEVRSTSDPTLRLGTRLVWEVKFMGREEYTLEVTGFEPERWWGRPSPPPVEMSADIA